MALDVVMDFTRKKLMDSVFNKIKSLITEWKISATLNDYFKRYKINTYESFGADESYDWEGLTDFIKDDIVMIIADCFLLPKKEIRKRMINQLYRRSYIKANAVTITQQNKVNELLNEAMSLVGESLRGSVGNTFPFNIVVDEIGDLIETWEASLKNDFYGYSATVVREIAKHYDIIFDKISYNGSFAEWINGITLPQTVNTLFHYRNPKIRFHGRKAEIRFLNEFLSASDPILFTAVTGSAGSGKSKLLYEYAKLMEANPEWKTVFIAASKNARSLTEYRNYNYPLNLLVIIDYAGDYAVELAEWMVMLRSCLNKPPKTRIILIERASASMVSTHDEFEARAADHIEGHASPSDEMHMEYPVWYKRMLGVRSNDDIRSMLYQVDTTLPFLNLFGLEDDDLFNIMEDYVKSNGREITQGRLKGVLSYCRNTVEQGRHGVRPLIALFIIDAWLNSEEYRSWNLGQLLEKLIDRYVRQWKDGLCEGDDKVYKSLENLIVYATATGGWDTSGGLPQLYNADLISLQERYDTFELNERFREVNEKIAWDGILSPLEPDLVGEFFVLYKMLKAHTNKRNDMITAFVSSFDYFTFVDRCANDYSMSDMFATLFGNAMEKLLPRHLIDNHPMTKLRLLFNLLLGQDKAEMEKTVEEIRVLTEEYDYEKNLLRIYAKSLLFLSGEQETEECKASVAKIRALLDQDEQDQEVALMYAAGLVNILSEKALLHGDKILSELRSLSSRYEHNDKIMMEYIKGLFNISCSQDVDNRLATVNELEKLSDSHAGNKRVMVFYAQALVNLANEQDKDAAKRTMIKLRDLLIDYDQNEDLWLAYMKRLVTLLMDQSLADGAEMLEELNKITKAYPDNDLIIIEYANGLYNYLNMKNAEDRAVDLETLRLIADRYEHIDEVMRIYMQAMYNFVNSHDPKIRVDVVNGIAMLDERFGHSEVFAFGYARCLYLLADGQAPADAVQTVVTLCDLMERFISNEEIAYHAAFGLYILMHGQEANEVEVTLNKIKLIAERFNENIKIVFAYAAGLAILSYFQNAVDGAATVSKLQTLHERFDDDSDIAREYAQSLVNISAEQDIKDAIFSIERLSLLWEMFTVDEDIALKYAEGLYNIAEKADKVGRVPTLDTLKSLHERYPHNEEIESVFKEAKQL